MTKNNYSQKYFMLQITGGDTKLEIITFTSPEEGGAGQETEQHF